MPDIESKMRKLPPDADLTLGIPIDSFSNGTVYVGHVGNEKVLVVRSDNRFFAIGSLCTHYNGSLAEGLVVGSTIRCPLHHACFDLRTGVAVRAPAFAPLTCWSVIEEDGKVYVRDMKATAKQPEPSNPEAPNSIVIIGGGAAGFAAAEMLRRRHYAGKITMLSDEESAPLDRPNLSKDYLAGTANDDWLPLQSEAFYTENLIDLRLGTKITGIDVALRRVGFSDGQNINFDRLLLATGSHPVRLTIPGAAKPHVYTLRSLSDCRSIIAASRASRQAVVLGASFIGLEVAAALRTRDVEVHVVAPDKYPMGRILGPDMGRFIRALHERHGILFHLETKAIAIEDNSVSLENGSVVDADLVIAAIGVHPRLELAERAGLALDRGVTVSPYLETSVQGIYAAGDIARWPDPHSGENIRVEHWVLAERQGQVAAMNMLGHQIEFDAVPFFWSQHYDVVINYVGHVQAWDDVLVEGDLERQDCLLRYRRCGRTQAVASISRDIESLRFELAMEEGQFN